MRSGCCRRAAEAPCPREVIQSEREARSVESRSRYAHILQYIMTNRSRTLYTGVTNNLVRRVYEHKHKLGPGFTSRYNMNRLVHYESTVSIKAAIQREKEIKGWSRAKKIALVSTHNPFWDDLSAGWYE